MTDDGLIDQWWHETDEGDQSMEDNHKPFWDNVINNVIDVDLSDKKILDFGCNQGGLLRRIYESMQYREAVGVDRAKESIKVAQTRKGDLPVTYRALAQLDPLDTDFDCALSTAVIYLIDDIADHGRQIFERLNPGGVYFSTHPDFVSDTRYKFTREAINEYAAIPCSENSLDEIIDGFQAAGFTVKIQRLIPDHYIPATRGSEENPRYESISTYMDFWYSHRYAFRCVKPE